MKYENLAETELLQLIAADNGAAYEVLYNRYWQPLFLFAYKRLKNKDESKDAVQDVFINLWKRRNTLQLTASLRTYLFTAVRYELLRKIAQSKKTSGSEEMALMPVEAATIDMLNEKELQHALTIAIDHLPAKMKEIYLLSRHQHKPIAIIAEELSLSEQTVKNQLSKALLRLRQHLKEATVIPVLFPCVFYFLNI
ncbi:sigma-70 family RNA polymerase sigma factor [Chitinophaga polysaccharea]|uniref:RNA polymerase sigma factor n=1 Tax=Chitinophaga TaxID=79328 RepID=UPI001455AA45|nr:MULTISPECIES: sigma-70 family RNA polymerase sigma factor [Chitinophaga]NLR58453.1 sigma-70 family RNA polymerase sigma factor [Chitinophaga polysaccharea]NLU90981.1 sigma-70 family RNA polymerase sigma factor [Chitinophaga sp. Ak27]